MPTSPRRIALYSHDTQGLGHIRRNLGIASALSRAEPAPEVLLLSGAREAWAFALPPNTDCLTLPSVHKDARGRYSARSLSTSLDDLIELRARAITAAVRAFDPDVLIVDKVARGAFGELEPTLEEVAASRRARVVLGLRDVLDDPITACREWHDTASTEAVEEFYDAVWVYGDPRVYDPVAEYAWPASVAAKVRYTGYLAPLAGDQTAGGVTGSYDVCLVGGGQDGQRLATMFLAADHPPGVTAVMVTGPYMAPEARAELEALAASLPQRRVLGLLDGCLGLIRGARAIVAMGGYNTTLELLVHGGRTLIVPRVRPRREQLVRAERLAALGLVDVCHPDALSGEHLEGWLAADPLPSASPRTQIDLDGLRRLPGLVDELFGDRDRRAEGLCRVAS